MTRLHLALALACGVAFALNGCHDPSPRLETSSDEAMLASMERMSNALPPDQREELKRAIAVLAAPRMAEASRPAPFGADAAPTSQAGLMRPFDGMTAKQLIARSKEPPK